MTTDNSIVQLLPVKSSWLQTKPQFNMKGNHTINVYNVINIWCILYKEFSFLQNASCCWFWQNFMNRHSLTDVLSCCKTLFIHVLWHNFLILREFASFNKWKGKPRQPRTSYTSFSFILCFCFHSLFVENISFVHAMFSTAAKLQRNANGKAGMLVNTVVCYRLACWMKSWIRRVADLSLHIVIRRRSCCWSMSNSFIMCAYRSFHASSSVHNLLITGLATIL